MHHNSVGQPKFIMKVVQYHRSALSRQVGEAIRIQRRGGVTLNSRGEFNRCKITRLSLEQMDHENGSKEHEGHDHGRETDTDMDWTTSMLKNRDRVDGEWRKTLGRVTTIESSKRKDATEATKRSKKRKYDLIGEDWGVAEQEHSINPFLYSGLEGVRRDGGGKARGSSRNKSKSLERVAASSRKITDWVRTDQKTQEIDQAESADNSEEAKEVDEPMCVNDDEGSMNDKNAKNGDEGSMNTKNAKNGDEGSMNAKNVVGSKKHKVWTKLKNGMYGWRVVRTRLAKHNDQKLIPGAGTPISTSGQRKWVPAQWRLLRFQS